LPFDEWLMPPAILQIIGRSPHRRHRSRLLSDDELDEKLVVVISLARVGSKDTASSAHRQWFPSSLSIRSL